MKSVVITGPTGAIGTALIRKCIEEQVYVLALVNRDSKRKENIPISQFVKVVECNIDEYDSFSIDDGDGYDVFYHLAWMGTSGAGRNDMYLQNQNVKFALDAVNLAKRVGCKRFVGIGSQAEYGRCDEKLTPNTPTFPEMGYGYAKLCAGFMTKDLAKELNMEHIWVRVLSIYGPNDGAGSMISSLIEGLKNGKVPEMTKGEQRWDYLYSGDAADALFGLGNDGIDGKTYVLGNGTTKTVAEYAQIVRDCIDQNINLNFGTRPYSDKQIMYLCADISEITKDTGWKPVIKFSEGIKQIHKENGDLL